MNGDPIAETLGKKPGTEMPGGVYRVGLPARPQGDVDGVEINDTRVRSWLAFQKMGDQAMVYGGDLVLTATK